MPSSASAIDPSQVQWDAPAAASAPPTAIDPSQVQWDAPAANQTAGGAVQAAASGLNAGSADLLGLPVDTARNILELGKAGLGFAYHETTGNQIPDILQPSTTPDVGSSAWIKQKLQDMEGGKGATEATENTTANRVIHGATEAVPSSVVGGQANTVPAVARAVTAGAAAGAAQQGAAEAGGSTGTQAAVGLLAGALTHRAIEAPTTAAAAPIAAPTIEPTKFTPPELSASTSPRAAPFTDLEGAPPRLQINGQSTAADAARASGTPVELIATPSAVETSDRAPITSPDEQAARQQTLQDIGLTEARESAVTGDTKAAGTDFQTSKLDNAAGDRMTNVIDAERGALQGYAGQIADASGGSRGLDSPSLYQRGEAIAKPVEELSDYFDAKTKQAYQAADQAAGGVPIDMPATGDFLKNQRSQFLGTVEGKQLREGVQARMRDLGLMDEDGNVQQATVQQAERLKQYLGDQWSPRTSRLIGQLKGAIDDDVTKAAGSDIYANARQTRALRATLLDDPTGIAKLAAPDDRLGINRTVPLEQVPDYVANLPVDQFGHIVKTLRDVPPEVQPSAASALNEIRSHFANRVEAAGNSTQGMWNTKGVNEYLNKNQLKMAEVYSPEEMQRFKTLSAAGNILKMDRTYPGAAAQTHNLAMRGVMQVGKVAGKLGGIAGLVAGHGVEGGAAGHVISSVAEKGVNKLGDRALLGQIEKRIRKF
jgi:hypothetical protein